MYVENEPAELTGAEFAIITALIRAGGKVLSRQTLLAELAQPNTTAARERTIDVHIASMRKKLGSAGNIIKTVHGAGYRYEGA